MNSSQKVKNHAPKGQNELLDEPLAISFDELNVMRVIRDEPKVTQKKLAEITGKSPATVKRRLDSLKKKRFIRRMNGKRYGYWEILIDIRE